MDTLISGAYVGFYRLPVCWFIEAPPKLLNIQNSLIETLAIVKEGKLSAGIHYRVRRDGFILFDMNEWEPGTYTEIPGYEQKPGCRVPKNVVDAEYIAETRAHNRAMLINAYQVCLNSSESEVRRRSGPPGVPVLATQLINLPNSNNPLSGPYHYANDPYTHYINREINAIISRDEKAIDRRRVIEKDVLDHSFILLDKILSCEFDGTLKLVEMLFWAHHRYSENAFPDSLILSWAICERIMSSLWNDYLRSENSKSADEPRVSKARLKKLEGRDFTASVVSEILELTGVIDNKLYRDIDSARKLRNSWLHSLQEISSSETANAMRTAARLLEIRTGVKLTLGIVRTLAGTGGFPPGIYAFRTIE